jgi:hypothetical protein
MAFSGQHLSETDVVEQGKVEEEEEEEQRRRSHLSHL